MIYKEIVEGKIFVTNVPGLLRGSKRIEVYTEREFFTMQQKSWWNRVKEKYGWK